MARFGQPWVGGPPELQADFQARVRELVQEVVNKACVRLGEPLWQVGAKPQGRRIGRGFLSAAVTVSVLMSWGVTRRAATALGLPRMVACEEFAPLIQPHAQAILGEYAPTVQKPRTLRLAATVQLGDGTSTKRRLRIGAAHGSIHAAHSASK